MNKKDDMIMFKTFKQLLGIQVLASATALLSVFIDSIVISRFLGTNSMAAFGFAQPVTLIMPALGFIFIIGTQGLVGRLLGKGDIDGVNRVVTLAIFLSASTGVLVAILIFVFSETIVHFVGARGEIEKLAIEYLKTLSIGIPFLVMGPLFTSFMQIDNDTKRSFMGVLTMTISNVILDLLVACVFHLGMFGMALATVISAFINWVILLFHWKKKDIMLHPKLSLLKFGETLTLIMTGFPAAVQQICIVVRTTCLNIMLTTVIGTIGIAAFAIQNSIVPLMMAVINGFGITMVLVSGTLIGEEDRYAFVKLIGNIIKLIIFVMVVVAICMFVFSKVLAGIFVSRNEMELYNLVAKVFRYYAISVPLCAITTLFVYYCQGMKRLITANVMYVCELIVFVVGIAYILSRFMGMDGVCIAFTGAEICSILLILLIIIVYNKRFPRNVEEMLMLPKDFGVDENNRMNITATDKESAVQISENIIKFCVEHGIDKRRAYHSGLCMEEITCRAIERNMKLVNKPCKVDVYLVVKDDELRIRLRNDGVPFDPKEHAEVLNSKDNVANVAIRAFYSIVKDVEFNNYFGLNVLAFTV